HGGDVVRDVLARTPDVGEALAAPKGDLALRHRHRCFAHRGHGPLDSLADREALGKAAKEIFGLSFGVIHDLRALTAYAFEAPPSSLPSRPRPSTAVKMPTTVLPFMTTVAPSLRRDISRTTSARGASGATE